ncbi:fungal-specific transcription factor domain-containing protein [Aspergillus pseudotamarii]|uniref:Fungal-specific transcription factor domain-containing protein n=1 Tax=Aspergillus pseudotamarii TaxID=132259 RepID=A0A5N6SZP7_ASPPS|nr:fungal-specific transcription factor domain-containing protein [Aspergillus pseudotamarii]KAE8138913.1 fungal-specific transcription factor domain-containing protein [Aspergillus pseudotamarii]
MSEQPPTAAKDCSNCQRRRLKCDRVRPACRKCGKRCLKCPGYGVQLKWDQGVASRGNLMGRSLPMKNSSLVSKSPGHNDPRIKSHSHLLDPTSNLRWLQPPPHSPHAPRLLAWFTDRVARRLAWVDGPQNPWRRIVLPLSETCDAVRSSVFALAATDLSLQYPKNDPWCQKFKDLSQSHHRHALSLLVSELKRLSALPPSETCPAASLFPTLASVMIICNNDLLNTETSEWRMHLTVAREILNVAKTHPGIEQSLSHMQRFFLQEYYATSVWMNLTNFKPVDKIVMKPPTSNEDAALSGFVHIIHRITQLERLKRAGEQSLDSDRTATSSHCQAQGIYTEIESARADSLQITNNINFWSDVDRRNFALVVRMYYHATLIYTAQALLSNASDSDASADAKITYSHTHIMHDLKELTKLRTGLHFAQDLVWPLFIAGTEVRSDRAAQEMIEHSFKAVMHVSRTLDRARVLSFLRSWWEFDGDGLGSWIEFARIRSENYNFIIV